MPTEIVQNPTYIIFYTLKMAELQNTYNTSNVANIIIIIFTKKYNNQNSFTTSRNRFESYNHMSLEQLYTI